MGIDTRTMHYASEDARNREIKIYVNGEILCRDEAKVSSIAALHAGHGMGEGMRLYNWK